MAVDDDAELDAQAWRMPTMNFALHSCGPHRSTGLPTAGRLKPVPLDCGVRKYASRFVIGAIVLTRFAAMAKLC
jgi:hypothetical protein